MTERYQHVVYKIGHVADPEEKLSPEMKARILEKMNQRLWAHLQETVYGGAERRRENSVLRINEEAGKVCRGPLWQLTAGDV